MLCSVIVSRMIALKKKGNCTLFEAFVNCSRWVRYLWLTNVTLRNNNVTTASRRIPHPCNAINTYCNGLAGGGMYVRMGGDIACTIRYCFMTNYLIICWWLRVKFYRSITKNIWPSTLRQLWYFAVWIVFLTCPSYPDI